MMGERGLQPSSKSVSPSGKISKLFSGTNGLIRL